MTPFRALAATAALLCVSASAFVPPVPAVVREIFDGRKFRRATEVVLHHRVEPKSGEVFDIEERVLSEKGRTRIRWRIGNQVFTGTHDREGYGIDGSGRVESRSRLFLKYLLNFNGDDFLAAALDEGFVRRDQLQQFKPGYSPEGDPNLWNARDAYLRHADVFFHRVRQGISIAVIGREDGDVRRAIYFDQAMRGIRRIEWKDAADKIATWDFESFFESSKEGKFPKHLSFSWNGDEKIRSELIQVRAATDRQVAEFGGARGASPSGGAETALQFLLTYR